MPSLPSYYDVGTATVPANGTVVTFQGAGTIADILRANDLFGTHVGSGQRISAVGPGPGLTASQVSLAFPWRGPAQTTQPYEVQFTPYSTNPTGTLEELVTLLKSGNVAALAGLSGAGGNKLLRLTGAGTMDTIDSRNLASLSGLAGIADRLPYFSGPNAMSMVTFTAYMRAMLAMPDVGSAQAYLGGGAKGRAIFGTNSHSDAMVQAGILENLGSLANNSVLVIPLGGATNGHLLSIFTNTWERANWYAARTASSANGIGAIGTPTSGNVNLSSGILTGTTGPTNSLNLGAANNGNLYIENRVGFTINLFMAIISPSRA